MTGARATSGSPEIWRRCAEPLEIDTHGVHPEKSVLGDHLAVPVSSIDSPEQQGLTIEKFLQANVHGTGASPMDVDPLAKTKGGKKAKEKTRAAIQRSSMATASGVACMAM